MKTRGRSRGMLTLLTLLAITIQCSLFLLPTASALEATFTPNPADSVANGGDGGPLPVSMQQRKQLLELEAAIVNSQDPAATLSHVAQQNGMAQEELAGMLDRNRKDLQDSGQLEDMSQEVNVALQAAMAQGGGGGGGAGGAMAGSLPRRVLSLIVSIFMALMKTASVQISRYPTQSTLLAVLLASTLLAVHNAPKNGIVISTPFSRGHTTLLEPPMDYLQSHSVRSWEKAGWISSLPKPVEVNTKKKSSKSKKNAPSKEVVGGVGMTLSLELDTSDAREGEVTVETSRSKEEGFSLVTSARTLISIESQEDEELQEEEMECMHESIAAIFEDRTFTEFVPGGADSLKFRSFLVAFEGDDEDVTEGAVMAMKLLGDFGRYGVQPLCVSYETDVEDDDAGPMIHCVAFHTLTGGHFDGELRFSVEEKKQKKKAKAGEPKSVVISATLAIPIGGRAPPTRLAESLVSSLTSSIAQSTQIRMKQTLSRRSQSKSYREKASGRATLKRHLKYEQEKAQEDMAAERKRRWKRNNPDAGNYRPSGHRLRSPHNCGLGS